MKFFRNGSAVDTMKSYRPLLHDLLRGRSVAYFILAIALFLTGAAWYYVAINADAKDFHRFERTHEKIREEIESSLDNYIDSLHATRGRLSTSPPRRPGDDIRRSSRRSQYPAQVRIVYAARVLQEEKDAHISDMRRLGFAHYTLRPSSDRQEFFPVVNLEPFDEDMLGYDISFDPMQRAAMEQARDAGGEPTATAKINLAKVGAKEQPGVLIYLPVYPREPLTQERTRVLMGFVYTVLRTDQLVDEVFKKDKIPTIELQVFDGKKLTYEHLLYSSGPYRGTEASHRPRFTSNVTVNVAGRMWTLHFSTLPSFDSESQKNLPLFVLLSGSALSIVLFSLFLTQARARAASERMTADLYRSERVLQSHLERLEALREIDQAVSSTLELQRMLDLLLEKLGLFFPHSWLTVRLANEADGKLQLAAWRNLNQEELQDAVQLNAPVLASTVFKNKSLLTIDDLRTDPRSQNLEMPQRHGLRSYLGAPLIVKDRALGTLTIMVRREHAFSPEETEFVSLLAGRAAVAIHNAQLYREMSKLAANLTQSNKVKDEFLSVMSHELRTPLTAIIGYAGMLQDGFLGNINQEQAKGLTVLLDQTKDLLALINSILEVTKIGAGTMVVENEVVNLKGFLDDLRLTYDTPLDKDLTLIWDYDGHLPRVTTDGGKLKRILQNLINNAIKFTDEGNVTISARVVEAMGNGQRPVSLRQRSSLIPSYVEFKVADTGIGIPKEALPVIFEKFRQVDSTETRSFGGVGLGLHIVKEFTEMLGGKVKADSEPGKGSVFTVTIPVEPQH